MSSSPQLLSHAHLIKDLIVQLKHMWEIERSLCYFIIKDTISTISLLEISKTIFMYYKNFFSFSCWLWFYEKAKFLGFYDAVNSLTI